MDEFLLLLQAKIDEAKSKGIINADIEAIQKQINHLKLQAEVDANSLKNITQQLSSILNQKIVIDNVQINANQATKAGQQTGQQIGNAISQGISSNLKNIKNDIDNTIKTAPRLDVNKIIGDLNLNRASVGSDVISQIRSMASEINKLGLEVVKTGNDSSWEKLISKSSELGKILDEYGNIRNYPGIENIRNFASYFEGKTISTGYKNSGLSGTDYTTTQLNKELKELGVKFSSAKQEAMDLNRVWMEMCETTGRMDLLNISNAQDQIQTVISELLKAQSILYGEGGLSPHPNSHGIVSDYITNITNTRTAVENLESEMSAIRQKEVQEAATAADAVVQNEEKKQQAIRETGNAYRELSENESIVKSGVGVVTFDGTNNAAKEAQQYFRDILKDEQAVIATTEKFGENNNLTSFSVNIKRASGEVETLRYTIDALKDEEGNIADIFYRLSGSSIGDAGAIKQIQQIENAFSKYTQKLSQFKSVNNGILSGLTTPLSDFESKLANLKNGTVTIDQLSNSFNELNAAASNITQNLGRKLSPIDAAINKIAKGSETISDLRAEFKGLNNAPKEINAELNKCSSLLENIKKIECEQGTTEAWSNAYNEWAKAVENVTAKINTLKKEQSNVASTQIFNINDLWDSRTPYMSKVYNTIDKQYEEISKMAARFGFDVVDTSGIEKTDGMISKLTLTVRTAEGALKQFNMQREKLQGNGKAQYGLMQVGDVKVLETAIQAQENLSKSIEKEGKRLSGLKTKWEEQGVLVGEFKTKVEQLETALSSVGSKNELDGLKVQMDSLKSEASQLAELNKIQFSLGENGNISTKISTITDGFTKLGLSADNVRTKMSNVDSALLELKRLMDSGANNAAIISQYQNLQSALKQTENDLRSTRSEYSLLATTQQKLALANDMEAWKQKNTKITKEARTQIEQYIISLRDLNNEMSKIEFGNIKANFKSIENSMRGFKRLGQSFTDQMKQAASSFSMWLSASTMVMKFVTEIRQSVEELKEVNTLITEISKANENLSKSDLAEIANESFDVASVYGKKASNYLSAVQETSRAGYENALGIAELSVAAQGAGDMTQELANQMIIATDKAYKLGGSVSELRKVLDGVNYITNRNAVNMTELSEGMSIVGSTAAAFGVDIDELSAALGTMIATTQQSGSEVARAFRAILLNIRQVSDEEEGIDAEGLTKYEKACNALGVSLKETKDGVLQLRDPMKVLEELSAAYVQLDESDLKRTELLNSVGGKIYHVIQKCVTRTYLIAGNA